MGFFGRPPFPPGFGARWRRRFFDMYRPAPPDRPRRPDEEPSDGGDDPDDGDFDADGSFFGPEVDGMDLHRRSFSRRLDTGHQARLRIENRNGLIGIRTHEQPTVTIDVVAELYASSDAEADAEVERLQRGITAEGERVDIRTPDLRRPELFFFGRGPRVDYEIRVPPETEVWASSRNGPVLIAGTHSNAFVEQRNGRVTIEDVAGDAAVESRNGRVTLERVAGGAKVASTNGPITIDKVQGEIHLQTRNGSVDVVDPGAAVRARSTNGPIRYKGRVAGNVDLEATNGPVRFAVPPGSRFEIDAESIHGSVRSDLPVRDRPPAAEGAGPPPKVRLRTTNGSIRVSEL